MEQEKHRGFSEEDLAEEKGLRSKENMLIKKPSFKVEIPNIANIFFMKLILKPQVKFENLLSSVPSQARIHRFSPIFLVDLLRFHCLSWIF